MKSAPVRKEVQVLECSNGDEETEHDQQSVMTNETSRVNHNGQSKRAGHNQGTKEALTARNRGNVDYTTQASQVRGIGARFGSPGSA
jgi:hypothetical protein